MSQHPQDLKQHLVLFVEDEQRTRKYFGKLFGKDFRIILAEDGVEGLQRFRENQDEVGVVVTDERMPNETGTAFLEKVAILKPNVVRILSTAYSDIDAAVKAVNQGGIYRYVTKPWEVPELEVTLKRAMELYMVRLEREELVRQKMMSVDMLAASDRIISLAALAIFRDSGLRYVGEAIKAIVLLSEGPREKVLPETIGSEGLSWRELYRRHQSFLGAAGSSLPRDLTTSHSISYDERCPVREALEPIVAENPALVWGKPRATAPDWPGPPSEIRGVVEPFLRLLGALLQGEGVVKLEECLSGLEVVFPGRAVRTLLQPAMSSTAEEPSSVALDLIAACMRMTHHGGVIDFLPEPNQPAETRLRLGFEVTRIERAPHDPFEELAADLVGNELFWSRFVD